MKKLLIFSVVAIMAAGAYLTVNSSSNQENDLVFDNIEALSDCEITNGSGKVVFACKGGGKCSDKKLGHTLTCDGTRYI